MHWLEGYIKDQITPAVEDLIEDIKAVGGDDPHAPADLYILLKALETWMKD